MEERPKVALSNIKNAPTITVTQPEKSESLGPAKAKTSLTNMLEEIAGILPENKVKTLPDTSAETDYSMYDKPSRRAVDEHEAWVQAHTLSDETVNLWIQNCYIAERNALRTPPRTPRRPRSEIDDDDIILDEPEISPMKSFEEWKEQKEKDDEYERVKQMELEEQWQKESEICPPYDCSIIELTLSDSDD